MKTFLKHYEDTKRYLVLAILTALTMLMASSWTYAQSTSGSYSNQTGTPDLGSYNSISQTAMMKAPSSVYPTATITNVNVSASWTPGAGKSASESIAVAVCGTTGTQCFINSCSQASFYISNLIQINRVNFSVPSLNGQPAIDSISVAFSPYNSSVWCNQSYPTAPALLYPSTPTVIQVSWSY